MKYLPIFVTLLILLAAFVTYFACDHCRGHVEGRLNTAARLALDEEGYSGVNVTFDRLDANLSGQVPNDAAKIKAGQIVANLSGARLLTGNNQIQSAWVPSIATPTPSPEFARPTPQPESQPSSLGLLWDAQSIRINGIVPDESTKQRILAVFQARKPGFKLIDNLKVDPTAQVAGWAPRVPALLARHLEASDSGAIQLEDSRLVLSGPVIDDATKSLLGNEATLLVEDPGLVENLLTVIEPSASAPNKPSSLGLSWDAESIRINGTVPDASTRQGILAVFQARKPGFKLIDNLKVDPTAPVVGWAPRVPALLAQQLEATDAGSIQLEDSRLVLSGIVKDEATKSRLGSEAIQLVEDPSLIENLLTVIEPPIAVTQTPAPEAESEAIKNQEAVSSFKKNAIYFASGSRSLSAKDVETIKALAESVKALPENVRLFVGGYADSSGNPEANRRLSIARATAVKDQLVAFGVPKERLVVNSFGAEQTSRDELWKSRRVELSIRED